MRTQFKNTPSRARSLSLSKGLINSQYPFDKLRERIDTIGGQSLPGFNEHSLLY